jgi:hypothetical protein
MNVHCSNSSPASFRCVVAWKGGGGGRPAACIGQSRAMLEKEREQRTREGREARSERSLEKKAVNDPHCGFGQRHEAFSTLASFLPEIKNKLSTRTLRGS